MSVAAISAMTAAIAALHAEGHQVDVSSFVVRALIDFAIGAVIAVVVIRWWDRSRLKRRNREDGR